MKQVYVVTKPIVGDPLIAFEDREEAVRFANRYDDDSEVFTVQLVEHTYENPWIGGCNA